MSLLLICFLHCWPCNNTVVFVVMSQVRISYRLRLRFKIHRISVSTALISFVAILRWSQGRLNCPGLHVAWAPEGHQRQSQAGPMGLKALQLKVGTRRDPWLRVVIYYLTITCNTKHPLVEISCIKLKPNCTHCSFIEKANKLLFNFCFAPLFSNVEQILPNCVKRQKRSTISSH